MKPILFGSNETQFNTNGLGRLADAISCKVTEERNGLYELTMDYPITGIHYADLAEDRIIYAKPFDGGSNQAFRIYYISEPLNGVVTVNAEHISYLLNKMVAMPFTAGSAVEAMAKIPQNTVGTNPFTFWTDKAVTSNLNLTQPKEIRKLLGGESGSILDVYGKGEYEFDNFTVKLHLNRGTDTGITLRYGKNITELRKITDTTGTYVGIVPFWADDTQTVTLPEKVVYSEHENDYHYKVIKVVDFTSSFEFAPTETQLRAKAQRYVESNQGWTIKQTIKVSFIPLWGTEEYKNVAPLERVRLCDTVNVFVKKLNINAKAKVVKTVYNVLLERYDSIELGDSSTSMSKVIDEQYIAPSVQQTTSHMDQAISHATKLIQGGLGGHVVMKPNADGEPEEILIMDTDDVATAVNVLRINMNGIGFSSTGYNGPFRSAWTIDGHFVADFIDTGTLQANLIKTGLLSDYAGVNSWNMETGELHLSAATNVGNSTIATQANVTVLNDAITAEVTRAGTAEGNLSASISINSEAIAQRVVKGTVSSEISQEAGKINIAANRISITSNYFSLTDEGEVTATKGTIGGWNIGDTMLSYIKAADKGAGMIGTDAESNLAFWAGANAENKQNAPFRVYHDGSAYLNNATINGYTTTTDFNAATARIQSIESDYITTGELNAVDAKFQSLNANNITSGTVNTARLGADVITTNNFTSQKITAGMINSGVISASKITSGTLGANVVLSSDAVITAISGKVLSVDRITANSAIDTPDISISRTLNSHFISWGSLSEPRLDVNTTTINGTRVVTSVSLTGWDNSTVLMG